MGYASRLNERKGFMEKSNDDGKRYVLQSFGERVLIKENSREEKTKCGIILPGETRSRAGEGVIVSVGS